jgi:UDP-N-acetylmuramoyl-tripeptide--D-alanyl-D-alanine ligase
MDVIAACNAQVKQRGNSDQFTAITTDSRDVKKGSLFCALTGTRFDGHKFVASAFRKGASGALIRKGKKVKVPRGRWLLTVDDTLRALGNLGTNWRDRFEIPVIAITGSNGKTTTKELIAQTLASRYAVLKTEGNYNNLIGVPWTLFRITRKHELAVLEMGMNSPGEIDRLAQIARPQIGVLTSIGRAHLEGLGSITAVARAKAELLKYLPSDGLAVINADDPRVLSMAKQSKARVLTYGFGSDAIIRGRRFKSLGFKGSSFEVRLGGKTLKVRLELPGRYNAVNALAALAIGHHFNVPLASMARSLKNVRLPGGRMTQIRLKNGIHIIDDSYNANPESVREALSNLDYTNHKQRKIVVLGDMLELGKFSQRAHREIGRAAVEADADTLFAVGEWSGEIANGAKKAGLNPAKILCFETAKQAGKKLREYVRRNDLILIKGSRGIHLEEVVHALKQKKAV